MIDGVGSGTQKWRARAGLLAVSAAIISTLALAPSASAFAWQRPVAVAGPYVSEIGTPRIATDSSGDLLVAWLDSDRDSGACPCVVQAAYRPAGGSFRPAVAVSPTIANPNAERAVHVAMDAGGDAIVGYVAPANPGDADMRPDTVYAAIRPAGGSFRAPRAIAHANGPDDFVELDSLRMDAAGDAVAAIANQQRYSGPDARIASVIDAEVVTRPAGGAFDATHPQVLSSGTEFAYPRALSMSPDGHAVIALKTEVPNLSEADEQTAVEVATSAAPGRAFGDRQTIETVAKPQFFPPPLPDVDPNSAAIDNHGEYVVAYTKAKSESTTYAKASIDGDQPVVLNPRGDTSSSSPQVVMDPSGEAIAVASDGRDEPATSVRPPGGSFGSATIDRDLELGTLANAANLPSANGDVIYSAAQRRDEGRLSAVMASIRRAGAPDDAPFPEPMFLTDFFPPDPHGAEAPYGTDAAIDPQGDAAVAWVGPNGGVRAAIGLASQSAPPSATQPKIGTPRLDKKNGTAKLPVTVSGTGAAVLTGKGIKTVTTNVATRNCQITMVVKPIGARAKRLRRRGKARARVKVAFSPIGRKTVASTRTLNLIEIRR